LRRVVQYQLLFLSKVAGVANLNALIGLDDDIDKFINAVITVRQRIIPDLVTVGFWTCGLSRI
jgi:hypothetical protein